MKKTIFAVLFAFSLLAQAAAQNSSFPRLVPDPKAVEYALITDYSWSDLAGIALWASGADPLGELTVNRVKTTYIDYITALAEEAVLALDGESGEKKKAEALLGFMYDRVLKRYSLNQTQIDSLLKTGAYNCVSSAVFYLVLGARIGLDVRGVITRDHAFVSVKIDGELIDIETTNRFGFDPGTKKEFEGNFGKTTGFAYVPPGNYRSRSEISPLELVSLILANRIASTESQRKYKDAVPIAIDREALLAKRESPAASPFFGDPAADTMDRIFNFAGSLLNSRKEDAVLEFADYARAAFPNDERWETIQYDAVNNMVAKLLKSGNIDGAKNAVAQNAARYPESRGAALSAAILDAQARLYHNQFAALFNRRKYEDAKVLLDSALLDFPADKQLKSDLDIVNKALAMKNKI